MPAPIFELINSITNGKQPLVNEDNEHTYVPFVVNRALSYFPDTLALANFINNSPELGNKMQYDFLFSTVRKKFRRGQKWVKTDHEHIIDLLCEYYNCNVAVAQQYASILPDEEIQKITKRLEKGGKR